METLQFGSNGPDVEILQKLLLKKGYSIVGKVDGGYGNDTKTAVEQFQTKNGLSVDGIATEHILELLGYVAPLIGTITGVDVSAYQANVNWTEVAASGVKFAYVKAGEGLHTIDSLCKSHAEGALTAGLKIGYYYYSVVADSPQASATFLDSIVKSMPAASLPLVLDIEANATNLSPTAILEWIQTFFATLRNLGHSKVMIYSGPAFLNENLPVGHGLGNIPLWLAAYTNGQPPIPHGWENYAIWQYSGNGTVSGIAGSCDVDKAVAGFIV